MAEFSTIKKFTSIGWGTTIGPAEHNYRRVTTHEFLYSKYHNICREPLYDPHSSQCTIGNDVWIGSNSTLLRGVSIGDGAVIGANCLVTKDVPPYAIVVGVPAKVLKYRFSQQVIDLLLEIAWWDLPDDVIARYSALFANEPNRDVLEELLRIKAQELQPKSYEVEAE